MQNELDPSNPVKEYTGVWIPSEVMEDERLSATEKLIYAEIACFKECYGSNAWLAKRVGRSEATASRAVARLVELGFVKNCGFNGRFRLIRVVKNDKPRQKCLGSLGKNDEAASSKMPNIDKSIDKSKDNSITTNVVIVAEPQNKDYGNEKINNAFELWESTFGIPQKNNASNRRATYNLLRSKGEDWIANSLKILLAAKSSKYVRKEVAGISNYADLQKNWEYLWNWGRDYAEKHSKMKVTDKI